MKGFIIQNKAIILIGTAILLLILTSIPIFSKDQESINNNIISRGTNYDIYDAGNNKHNAVIYSYIVNILNTSGRYEPFENIVTMENLTANSFIIKSLNSNATVTFKPATKTKGMNFSEISNYEQHTIKKRGQHEFLYEMSLPDTDFQPSIIITSNNLALQGKYAVFDDVIISFEDLLKDNYTYSVSQINSTSIEYIINKDYAKEGKTKNSKIVIDPFVQAGNAGIIDTYVDQGNSGNNFSSATNLLIRKADLTGNKKIQVKANVTDVLNNAKQILSADYEMEAATGPLGTFNITLHEIFRENLNWNADNIDWNNQTCGTTINASCNLTFDSAVLKVNPAAGSRYNWSITKLVNNSYNASTNPGIFAFLLNQSTTASTTTDFNFISVDAADATNRPIIYISYIPYNIPLVQFVSPTPPNGTSVKNNYNLPINVSASAGESENISTFIDFNNSLRLYLSMDNSSKGAIPQSRLWDNSSWGNHVTNSLANCNENIKGISSVACNFTQPSGNEGYLRINYTSSLDIENWDAFTIQFWMYYSAVPNYDGIYQQANNTPSNGAGVLLYFDGTGILWLYINSGYRSSIPSAQLPINQWHHITAIWNGTHTMLFKNATLIDRDAYSTAPRNKQSNVLIGGYETNGQDIGFPENKFKGTIDEFKIFSRALTPAEINLSSIGANVGYINFSLSHSNNGTYTYSAMTTDRLGRFNKTDLQTYQVNFTPPTVFNLSHAPISALAGSKFIFNGTVQDDDDGISNYTFWHNLTPTHLTHKLEPASGSDATLLFGNCDRQAEDFTPNMTGYITNISLKISGTDVRSFHISIWSQKSSGCGTNPCPDKLIENATINGTTPTTAQELTLTLNNTIKVTSGVPLWAVIDSYSESPTGSSNSIYTRATGNSHRKSTQCGGSYVWVNELKPINLTVRIGEFTMQPDPTVTISGTDPVQISVPKTAQYKGSFDWKICSENLVDSLTCSPNRNFVVVNDTDLSPPTVTFLSPKNNTKVNGNVSLKVKCLDNNHCQYVEMYYKTNNTDLRIFYANATLIGSNTWETTWNTATFDNTSNFQWNGFGVDDFFNAAHGNHFNYSIDRDIPIVNFTTVTYGEGTWGKYGENITLTINVSDPAGGTGISNVTINTSLINYTTDFSNMTFISGSKTAGQYSLFSFNATITQNTSGTDLEVQFRPCDQTSPPNCFEYPTQVIRIDSVAPQVTNTGRNGSSPVIVGEDISFFTDAADSLSGLSLFTISNNFTGTWNNLTDEFGNWFSISGSSTTAITNYTMNIPVGSYSWFFLVNDTKKNMNMSEAVYSLTVVEAPAGEGASFLNVTITQPVNNSFVNNGTFNISYLVKNSYNILETILFIDGTQNNTNTTPVIANSTNLIQTWALSEGSHEIIIQVTDDHAQINQSNVFNYTVDTLFPNITLEQPLNVTYNLSVVYLNYTIGDTNIGTCIRELNGINTTIANCANQTLDESILGEQSHKIVLWINDSAGNKNFSVANFTFTHIINGNVTLNRTGIPIPHYNLTENINASQWSYWDNGTQIGSTTTFIWNDTSGNIIRQINFTNNAVGFSSDNWTSNASSQPGIYWIQTIEWATQNGTVRNMVNQTAFNVTQTLPISLPILNTGGAGQDPIHESSGIYSNFIIPQFMFLDKFKIESISVYNSFSVIMVSNIAHAAINVKINTTMPLKISEKYFRLDPNETKEIGITFIGLNELDYRDAIIFSNDVGEVMYVEYISLSAGHIPASVNTSLKRLLYSIENGDATGVFGAVGTGAITESFIGFLPKFIIPIIMLGIIWLLTRNPKRRLKKKWWAIVLIIVIAVSVIIPPLA